MPYQERRCFNDLVLGNIHDPLVEVMRNSQNVAVRGDELLSLRYVKFAVWSNVEKEAGRGQVGPQGWQRRRVSRLQEIGMRRR